MLKIDNLHVKVDGKEILKGLTLEVPTGEVHAVMGPNGSGKSTLANVLSGRPGYEITAGTVSYQGRDLLALAPEERAREGVFLGFQYPVEIPGVNNVYLLKAAVNAARKHRGLDEVDAFEFLTLVSFAVPGTVIGVSYIVAFNVAPLELTGGLTILVLCFVFRNMPVGVRSGVAALAQIDRTLDEASSTLRASTWRTLTTIVLPLLRSALLTTLVFSFTRAMTAVSAVIFLATAQYNLSTVYIINRVEAGEYPLAIAYSCVLIVLMLIVLLALRRFVGEARLGRRAAVMAAAGQ